MVKFGLDLSLARSIQGISNPIARTANEHGQTCICAGDVALAADHFSPMCRPLRRGTQGQTLLLSRPVSVHGVCATDLSRESTRHRSLPAQPVRQTLPYGLSQHGVAQHAGQCQCSSRLAHLCRLYTKPDGIARPLYVDEPFGVDLSETVYALDATTTDPRLSVFPWALFRSTKAAIKLHTLLDLRGNIPSFIHISDGKLHDVNILDQIIPEAGAFYIMDRGYLDFARLHRLHQAGSFFVTRAKANLRFTRRYSRPTDRSSGIICDQLGTLTGFYSQQHFPTTIRRIKIK